MVTNTDDILADIKKDILRLKGADNLENYNILRYPYMDTKDYNLTVTKHSGLLFPKAVEVRPKLKPFKQLIQKLKNPNLILDLEYDDVIRYTLDPDPLYCSEKEKKVKAKAVIKEHKEITKIINASTNTIKKMSKSITDIYKKNLAGNKLDDNNLDKFFMELQKYITHNKDKLKLVDTTFNNIYNNYPMYLDCLTQLSVAKINLESVFDYYENCKSLSEYLEKHKSDKYNKSTKEITKPEETIEDDYEKLLKNLESLIDDLSR